MCLTVLPRCNVDDCERCVDATTGGLHPTWLAASGLEIIWMLFGTRPFFSGLARTIIKNPKLILVVVLVAVIGVVGWFWWQHQVLFPSTDDAYVQGNIITVAPLVAGAVLSVAVTENVSANAGYVLLKYDAS